VVSAHGRSIVYVKGALTRTRPYVNGKHWTRSWEEAGRMIVAAEERGHWTGSEDASDPHACQEAPPRQSVESAVDAFLVEAGSAKGRNLAQRTYSKYKTILSRFKQFSVQRGIVHLCDVGVSDLLAFKQTWPTGPRGTVNNIQRLRSFFKFCVAVRWICESPAKAHEYASAH
jgi:hypothetical protein